MFKKSITCSSIFFYQFCSAVNETRPNFIVTQCLVKLIYWPFYIFSQKLSKIFYPNYLINFIIDLWLKNRMFLKKCQNSAEIFCYICGNRKLLSFQKIHLCLVDFKIQLKSRTPQLVCTMCVDILKNNLYLLVNLWYCQSKLIILVITIFVVLMIKIAFADVTSVTCPIPHIPDIIVSLPSTIFDLSSTSSKQNSVKIQRKFLNQS